VPLIFMDREVLVFIGILFIGAFLLGGAAYYEGTEDGMIKVASGRWKCLLGENPDLTSKWVCRRSGE